MHWTYFSSPFALTLLLPIVSAVTPGPHPPITPLEAFKKRDFPPNAGYRMQMYRELPSIDYDDEHTRPHPNDWDQVEAAIVDALQLALVALELIDNDADIYPHYFSRRDREKVKAVYERVAGECKTGNVLLSKIHIQTTDLSNPPGCDKETLVYMRGPATDALIMVLCPPDVFQKKAYTRLIGDDTRDPETQPDRYLRCQDITADGQHVSYRMESLGALFLHEYLHYDTLTQPIYGRPILDQKLPSGEDAYGPVAVYDNLNKNLLSRVNADSYVFYAVHSFWREVCGVEFKAPRGGGGDDVDVDCGGHRSCHVRVER
ncbi:MAG: hypothetical protein L6R37_002883 [Teloschistes peruensis]|nr:MAG: hypothetical protein L6R37_002883 [Teloschistes peruensis]